MPDQQSETIFSTDISIRWGDMDAYGHVNNAQYLRYMEEARVQLLYKIGYMMDAQDQGPVVINVQATYLAAAIYPDTLRVDCALGKPGRSSFMTYYKLYSQQQDDQLICDGSAKVVWIDKTSNTAIALPDAMRHLIEHGQPL